METVETIVYLSLSIIIGILVLDFFTGWDVADTYDQFRDLIAGEPKIQFRTVDKDSFFRDAVALWQDCGMGTVEKSQTLYVKDLGTIDKDWFFANVNKLNLCYSLQSQIYGCGEKENVVFLEEITLPHVVKLSCDPITESLMIEGQYVELPPPVTGVVRSFSKTTVTAGEEIDVTLTITVGSSDYYSLDDTIPGSFSITSGSTGSATNIRLVEVSDAVDTVYTYRVKAPSTGGVYTFNGEYQFEGMSSPIAITGSDTVTVLAGPDAGVARSFSKTTVAPGEEFEVNLTITLDPGATYYVLDDDVPGVFSITSGNTGSPSNIRLVEFSNAVDTVYTYRLRAPDVGGTYTFSGEYQFEGMSGPVSITGESVINVTGASYPEGVTRIISKTTVSPGEEFDVTLVINIPDSGVTYYSLDDTIPSTFSITSGSTGSASNIRLVEVSAATDTSYTYRVKAPAIGGTYTFSGEYQFEGMSSSVNILGETAITVTGASYPEGVTRVFSKTTVSPGEEFDVTLVVNIPVSGVTYYSVDDAVPSAFSITSGATGTGNNIRLVEVSGAVDTVYTYRVRAPLTDGTYSFLGEYQFEGMSSTVAIMGSNIITVGSGVGEGVTRLFSKTSVLPGEIFDVDLVIDIGAGVTYYSLDDVVPSGFTITSGDTDSGNHIMFAEVSGAVDTTYSYSVQAPAIDGMYSFNGDYQFEGMSAPQVIMGQSFITVGSGTGEGVIRSFSKTSLSPGEVFNVVLTIDIGAGVTYYSLDDVVPSGFTITAGDTDSGNHIMFAEVSSAVDTTYSYSVQAPSSAGSYSFNGEYQFEGMSFPNAIQGPTTVTVN